MGRAREEKKRESLRRKKIQVREPVGQMRDEKLHTVVAPSTFQSQNAQNTPAPEHF